MKLEIQAICHKGLVRQNNEDALSIGGILLRDDSVSLSVTVPEDGYFYLLASDGMLVRRPILVSGQTVLVGFRESEWEKALL